MSWDELRTMMLGEYCPRNKSAEFGERILEPHCKRLRSEAYTTRLTELAILCSGKVTPVDKKVERCIWD